MIARTGVCTRIRRRLQLRKSCILIQNYQSVTKISCTATIAMEAYPKAKDAGNPSKAIFATDRSSRGQHPPI